MLIVCLCYNIKAMDNIIDNEFPVYTSPLGDGSIFNDEGYVYHVNFEKLIPGIKAYNKQVMPYDYTVYESKATVQSGDPFINNFFPPRTEEKSENSSPVDKLLDEIESVLTPPGIPVDIEYKDGKELLFFDGVLNKKQGYIKIDRDHIGFVFELDPAKKIIQFRDHIYYTDPATQKRKAQWAIQIETMNFETYRALCKAEGLYLSASSLDNIQRRYVDALNKAKDKSATMAWLYHWMPAYIFKTRDKDSLINDLATILQGSVREHGYKYINEEAIVLKIIGAFATGKKEDHDCLLGEFSTRLIDKKTMFEVLYEKMNDWGGQSNFTKAIQVLYLIWGYSSSANPNNHTYNGQPETLAYQSKKILGFYTDNYSFKFDKQSIIAYEKVTKHYRTGNKEEPDGFREELEFRASYSFFQPLQLPEIDQEGEMKLPDTLIPAFYLKAFADKNVWHDFEKEAWLVVDIITTFSGFGNLLKLRYLTSLPKWARILRLSFGVVELASGVMSTMLNFVNSCDEKGSFCSKLKNYLNWVNLCAGAADIAFTLVEKKLRQTAGEALEELGKKADAMLSKEEKQIKKHLKEVVGEGSSLERQLNDLFDDLGGRLLNKKDLKLLKQKLKEQYGVDLRLIDKERGFQKLPVIKNGEKIQVRSKELLKDWDRRKVVGKFDGGPPPMIILKSEYASELTIFHEMVHMEVWLKKLPKMHIVDEEKYVFETIFKAKDRMLWTDAELIDAYDYVNRIVNDWNKVGKNFSPIKNEYIEQLKINRQLKLY